MNRFLLVTFTFAFFGMLFLASFQPVEGAVIRRPPNNLGLVGYWPMDEGTGTSAGDFSGNGQSGTLNGDPQWTSGRFGNALDFVGSNSDYVNIQTTDFPKDDFSVSVWFNGGSHVMDVVDSAENRLLRINPTLARYIVNETVDNNIDPVSSTEWHHVVVNRNGSTVNVYMDGSFHDSFTAGGTLNTSDRILIGRRIDSPGYFTGTIDDIRIYSRALSASEIADLYNNSAHATRGSTDTTRFTDGLVSHWTFDGPHVTSATATDAFGSNDGTRTGNPTVSTGILGQAMEFDGEGDEIVLDGYDDFDMSQENAFTLLSWVKVYEDGNNDTVFARGDVNSNIAQEIYHLHRYTNNARWRAQISDGTSSVGFLTDADTFAYDQWYHLALRWDGSTNTLVLYQDGVKVGSSQNESFGGLWDGDEEVDRRTSIGAQGRSGGDYFDGLIDDVRIYNTALATSTIQAIYNATKPDTIASSQNDKLTDGLVGMWSFDGPSVSGSTVTDDSGNSNNGTINGDAKPTRGVIGQAMEFDGDGDYIQISNNSAFNFSGTDPFSISVWIYAEERETFDVPLGKERQYIFQFINTDGDIVFQLRDSGSWNADVSTTDDPITLNTWHHVVGVADGSNHYIYIDGELKDSGSYTSVDTENNDLFIGSDDGGDFYFKGKIDNSRIYDRAITADEVKRLYHLGR